MINKCVPTNEMVTLLNLPPQKKNTNILQRRYKNNECKSFTFLLWFSFQWRGEVQYFPRVGDKKPCFCSMNRSEKRVREQRVKNTFCPVEDQNQKAEDLGVSILSWPTDSWRGKTCLQFKGRQLLLFFFFYLPTRVLANSVWNDSSHISGLIHLFWTIFLN